MDFNAALRAFVAACQTESDADFARNYPSSVPPVFDFTDGPRYVRVFRQDRKRDDRGAFVPLEGRSAHCFVDKSNGDILKAAGWKAPAKGARGSIYAADLPTTLRSLYRR